MSDQPERTARRVVAGVDTGGRSTIIVDEQTKSIARRPDGSVVMDIWRVERSPVRIDDPDALDGVVRAPSDGGLVVRLCTFAPNSDMDAEAYSRAMADSYGDQAAASAHAIPGAHRTDTVDVLTVLSGELYAVLESGETLLRPGDSFVQRGTVHAWHNRSGQPATVVATMISAFR